MISGAEFRFTECPIDSKKKKVEVKACCSKAQILGETDQGPNSEARLYHCNLLQYDPE